MWGFTTVEVCVLSVSTALARLRDGLGESFPDSPGTRIIDIAFPLNDAFDPLLWCGQQAQWPQFYWQQRNGDEELATLGAVKTFPRSTRRTAFYARPGGRICVSAA
jgi:menaquinone-specific isochorismate synthase